MGYRPCSGGFQLAEVERVIDWAMLGVVVGIISVALGVVGSIGRVIIRQNSDSRLLEQVDSEVKAVITKINSHETDIAVLKQMARDMKQKIDETHQAVMEKLK